MNFDKYTVKLQSAIQDAAERAQAEQHSEVIPADIVSALAS